MARQRRSHNEAQNTIFDLPGMADEMDVHPSITDFVIHTRASERSEKPQTDPLDLNMEEHTDSDATPPLLFISLGSGSSGNCAYIGTRQRGVLIDAGVEPTAVYEGLRNNGLSINNVEGICLTHDHSDHVRYVYTIARKNPWMAIYCTPKTLNGLLRRHSISRRIKDYHKPIYKEFPFKLAGMELTAFDVSHDGTDNCGYFITLGNHRFAIATDLGCITDRVDYYMRKARYAMIESNYDALMLRNGPYPQYLKARIATERGHLDNEVTGRFLADIAAGLRYIFLCHLSQDNNTPQTALETVSRILRESGIDNIGTADGSISSRLAPLQLTALPRFGTSPLFVLRLDE